MCSQGGIRKWGQGEKGQLGSGPSLGWGQGKGKDLVEKILESQHPIISQNDIIPGEPSKPNNSFYKGEFETYTGESSCPRRQRGTSGI